MTEKVFSVITPALNSAGFLGDNLASVHNQKFLYEHIIKDGLSTDGSTRVFDDSKKILNLDRASFISKPDAGQSDALNQAIKEVSGQYVGWLNSDEFYMPNALEMAYNAFSTSKADVIYGDCYFVTEDGSFLRLLPSHSFSRKVLRDYGCFISSCATFMKASVLESNPFDENLRRCMDWDMWLKLSKEYKFQYVPFVFAAFRLHSNQITAAPIDEFSEEFTYFVEKHELAFNPCEVNSLISGKLRHIILKLISLAYLREISAKIKLKKVNLKWWEN